jgi:hypothetical protein
MGRMVLIGAAAYGLLSVVCFIAHDVPTLRSLINDYWSLVWLLGPPAALLFQAHGASAYALETAVFWGFLLGTFYSLSRLWAGWVFFCLGAVLTWLLCGFFVWASTV